MPLGCEHSHLSWTDTLVLDNVAGGQVEAVGEHGGCDAEHNFLGHRHDSMCLHQELVSLQNIVYGKIYGNFQLGTGSQLSRDHRVVYTIKAEDCIHF